MSVSVVGPSMGILPGPPVGGARVQDRTETEIEALIRARSLSPGDRLPSERMLAQMLGVSRSSLRGAIARLAARGRVSVRQTGVVVADPPASLWADGTIAAPLAPLFAGDPGYGLDVLEIRHALEGTAAWHAALRATPEDRDRIRARLADTRVRHPAPDAAAEARTDAAFHLAIAEASHNAVLRQVMASLFGLLRTSISQSLEKLYTLPRMIETLAAQHEALADAVIEGDADRARAASDTHLRFVETSLRRIDEDRARHARAAHAAAARDPAFAPEDRP